MSDHTTLGALPQVIDLRDHPGSGEPAEAVAVRLETGDDHRAERRHRQVRFAGLGLLLVLNALDLLTTKAFLDAGLQEGNLVGALLIENGWIAVIKAVLLLALGLRIASARPRLGTTCALWCVVGIYLAVVAVNTLALRTIGVL